MGVHVKKRNPTASQISVFSYEGSFKLLVVKHAKENAHCTEELKFSIIQVNV
jgi:hypothetical protein